MFRYFDPKQLLRQYYFGYGVNLHNQNTSFSWHLQQLFQAHYQQLAMRFGLGCHNWVIVPTIGFGIDLVQQSLPKYQKIFANHETGLDDDLGVQKLTDQMLVALGGEIDFSDSLIWLKIVPTHAWSVWVQLVQLVKTNYTNTTIIIDGTYGFYEDWSPIQSLVDGVYFNSQVLFQVSGAYLFGFSESILAGLRPIVIGSNSYAQLFEHDFVLNQDVKSFNPGTNNFAKNLLLLHYVNYYFQNQAAIDQDIIKDVCNNWSDQQCLLQFVTFDVHHQPKILNYNLL